MQGPISEQLSRVSEDGGPPFIFFFLKLPQDPNKQPLLRTPGQKEGYEETPIQVLYRMGSLYDLR